MKFSASIKNGFLLHKILSTLDRTASVILKISQDSFILICQDASSKWQSCITIETNSIFELPFTFASQAGTIHLQVPSGGGGEALTKAFRGLGTEFCSTFQTLIKLVRLAAGNCTALLVTTADAQGNIKLEHTVPVVVLTPLEAASLIQDPDVADLEQIQLLLPGNFRALRAACDNLKQQFKHVQVSATSNELVISTGKGPFSSEFQTKWTKLKSVSTLMMSSSESGANDADVLMSSPSSLQSCSVCLEVKDLCKAMQAIQANPTHGIVSVVNKHSLLLYFFLTPNTRTSMCYFLPNKSV